MTVPSPSVPHQAVATADPPLLLASTSPRRRELLAEAGVSHVARSPGVDDADLRPGDVSPAQWVAALSYLKARAGIEASADIEPGVVLAADTICVLGDRIIGQPRDAADAQAIIRSFEGCAHEVMTGVTILDARSGARDLFVDRATVWVGEIGDESIETYIASGEWKGKAGAYNLTERLAAGWPIRFEGDPTTIVGLPMRRLLQRLAGRAA